MKKRLITALLAATAVFGAVIGLAASLTVDSNDLGSGTDLSISSCDANVTTAYNYDGTGGVTIVTVGAITDGSLVPGSGPCDGQAVYVELLDSSGVVLASGDDVVGSDADITDESVPVTLDAAAPAASVAQARVTITG